MSFVPRSTVSAKTNMQKRVISCLVLQMSTTSQSKPLERTLELEPQPHFLDHVQAKVELHLTENLGIVGP